MYLQCYLTKSLGLSSLKSVSSLTSEAKKSVACEEIYGIKTLNDGLMYLHCGGSCLYRELCSQAWTYQGSMPNLSRIFFVHLLYLVELNKQQLKFPLLTRYVANIKIPKILLLHKTITLNISVFTIHLNSINTS